jgi:hypothetical protein
VEGIFHDTTVSIKQHMWHLRVNREENKHPAYYTGQLMQEIYVSGFGYIGHPDYPYLLKDETGYKVKEDSYTKRK